MQNEEQKRVLELFLLSAVARGHSANLILDDLLSGRGAVARAARDFLGLQRQMQKRGPKPKVDAIWSRFVVVEQAVMRGQSAESIFREFAKADDDPNGSKWETYKQEHRRAKAEKFPDVKLTGGISDFFLRPSEQ